MKKVSFFIVFIFLSTFIVQAYESNKYDWIEIRNKLYIDNNLAKFIENTYNTKALVRVKTLNNKDITPINNKKIWYKEGLYYIDCLEGVIIASGENYYDTNGNIITNKKMGKRVPQNLNEKEIYYYMCKTRRNYMLELDAELEKIEQNNLLREQVNTLEDIRNEIFINNWSRGL